MTETKVKKSKMCRSICSKLVTYLENKGIIYKTPPAETFSGWKAWRKKVKTEYPIQYFIREEYAHIAFSLMHRYRTIKYYIKTFLFPENSTIRNAIPKRNHDLVSIIPLMNFAALMQFKEEADKSCVDWDAGEKHKEFKRWLDESALWIKEGKSKLEEELQAAYPKVDMEQIMSAPGVDYETTYKEVNRIEDIIAQKEESILLQMISYRDYFWT